jgi:4-amino-4-deoxy-L-arabinose transferase-like glycosyltransferase
MGPPLVLALISLGVFCWITLQRAPHPFELEWMEGGSLQHLTRVLAGHALYAAPSIDFVPYPYPPFYYYAAIPVTTLFGVNLLSLRIVSVIATLATAMLLFGLVRHETRRWELGVICGGLFLATYRISGAYMDVGRLDPLFVALVVAGVYALRVREDLAGLVFAGVLCFLATLTKQTGLALFAPLMLWCVYRDGIAAETAAPRYRRSLAFVATLLGLVVIASFYLSRGDNSHFFFYVLGAQSGHEIRWSMLPYFIRNDLLLALPLAVACVIAVIVRGRSDTQDRDPDRLAVLFYLAYFVGTVIAWIVPRIKVGGAMNNLIPLHACLVLMLGVALGMLLNRAGQRPWMAPLAAAMLVVQFVWLGFDPRIALPRPGDLAAGTRWVAQLANVKGEVLIPAHGYIAGLAGKDAFAHQMPVDDLANSGLTDAEALREEFRQAITERRFELIIDSSSRFLEAYPDDRVLKDNYKIAGPVFTENADLVPRSGWQVGPGAVWVRRTDAD